MSDAALQIKGLYRLRSTMKKAGVDMADMKTANIKAATVVRNRGQQTAPKRTGLLANTMQTPKTVARASVRSKVRYAGPIHWGWPARNIRPQPFLWNAARDTRPEWMQAYQQDLERITSGIKGA
jgi:hypothetical protein